MGFEYKKAGWIQNSNVYEVNIRQYTPEGTFNAFLQELPRLKEMGVAILWLMPVTPISQKNKKGELGSYYACSDYTSVNPEFGTMDDLKNLVRAAHAMGFKIIIDWVANHTGWDHVWTMKNPDFYLMDVETNDFKMASGMEDIIELDHKNPALRAAMIDAMEFWVRECDIDGFRCDLAFWVTLDFWAAARTALEKRKTLFWLGEFDPLDSPAYCTVFDAAYTWTWMHKTETFYKRECDLGVLKNVLLEYETTCGENNIPLWFTSNHDENSWNGTEYEKYGDMAKALAVFSFTWSGMPLIYSGQELPNKKRLKFFEKDMIEWQDKCTLHEFYRTLLQLRKDNQVFNVGGTCVVRELLNTNDDDNVMAYLRTNGVHSLLVLLNMGEEMVHCAITGEQPVGSFRDVFSKMNEEFCKGKTFELPPWSYRVYENC